MQAKVEPPITDIVVKRVAGLPGGDGPETAASPRRRKRIDKLPFLLVAPGILIIFSFLAYPVYRMFVLATEKQPLQGRFSPTPPPPKFVGLDNFKDTLTDHTFWTVAIRTFVFTAVAVSLSMLISLSVALLMRRVSGWVRITMTVAMVFVWAIPSLVATQVFAWMVDSDFGVVNFIIGKIPGVNFDNHSWFSSPTSGWTVITALVLWGAIPFLSLTMYAGLTQVPTELVEAATIDGANNWQVLRNVLLPILRPVLIISTTLSVIWDFQVFVQIFALRNAQPESGYWTIGVYAYEKAFAQSDYTSGATISIITLFLMGGVMVFYVRQMIKIGEAE